MTILIPLEKVQTYGVPVYRLGRMNCEFVIKFPKACHARFSAGFNFVEGVNFCPADCSELGQHSADHYARIHRASVFLHAELLYRLAAGTETLDVDFCLM